MSERHSVRCATTALLFCVACGGGSSGGGSSATDAGPIDAPIVIPSGWTETPYLSSTPTRTFERPDDVLEDGVDYGALILTDVGAMVLDLAEDEAPLAVGSFVFLARHHFYDDVRFHRVIAGFMAQSGDPNSVSGAPSTWGFGGPGYEFVNETSSLRFDARGVLAMANAGRDTNGSQFFITFAAQPRLDGGFTIFGRLLEGDATLSSIAVGEPPPSPTRILTITILER